MFIMQYVASLVQIAASRIGAVSVVTNKSINEGGATKKRPVNRLQDAFSYTWLKPMPSI